MLRQRCAKVKNTLLQGCGEAAERTGGEVARGTQRRPHHPQNADRNPDPSPYADPDFNLNADRNPDPSPYADPDFNLNAQECPGVLRSAQECAGMLRSAQECSGVRRSAQECSGVLRGQMMSNPRCLAKMTA